MKEFAWHLDACDVKYANMCVIHATDLCTYLLIKVVEGIYLFELVGLKWNVSK